MSGNRLKTAFTLSLAAFCASSALWAQDSSPPSAVSLDAVVVTATRVEEKLREVTSNVTIIDEQAIKKSSAQNLKSLLRQQGIEVSGAADSPGMTQIILRGMRISQDGPGDLSSGALVLLNGRRFGGGGDPQFIGLSNVERIEIIRGPAAVQFGPAAMGGVVNIITRRGSEKPEIRLEAGAGSYDLERLKFAASGQSDNGVFEFSFGAGQQYQGDYKTGNGWVWEGSRSGNQRGFNADLGLNLDGGHRLGVNYYYSGVFGAEGPYDTPNYFNSAEQPHFTGLTSYDATNSNLALTYEGATEDKSFTWQGRFSFGQYDSKARYFYTPDNEMVLYPPPYNAQPGWTNATPVSTDMKNLSALLGYDAGGLFALSGGLDYMVYELNSGAEYKDLGAFLTGKLRFLEDSLILSAGGRFDAYNLDQGRASGRDASKTNFSPSVGLAWLPADWLKLRGNYSQGFRMPTPNQLWARGNGVTSSIGNPGLKPEKSKTWEVGLDASWEFINAGLTYFHSKYEDKIQGGRVDGVWSFMNIAGATIAGLELALSADLGQAFQRDFTLRPYINLTYMPTLRNDDYSVTSGGAPASWSVPWVRARGGDDTFPFVSRTTISYGLDFIEPNIDLMVNINASYGGEQLSSRWDGILFDSEMLYHTRGTVVDMSLEQGLLEFADLGKLKLRAEVNNLFDKYSQWAPEYPGAGRNFYVGLAYEY